jgi:hypothetical protein
MTSASRREFNFALASSLIMPTTAWSAAPTTLESLVDIVLRSQKAGLELQDWRAYIAPWSRMGTWVAKRTEQDSQYDITLSYEASLARIKLLTDSGEPTIQIKHTNVVPTIDASATRATVRVKTIVSFDGRSETTQEIFRLRVTDDGWRIENNTYWRSEARNKDRTIRFDATYFNQADIKVETALIQGPMEASLALFAALRWREAHELLTQATQPTKATANLWAMRAQAAFMIGDIQDAISAVKIARKRKSSVALPAWAKAIK